MDDAAALNDAFVAAWNALDGDAVAACFRTDGLFEDLAFGRVMRRAGEIKRFVDATAAAIPDAHFEVTYLGVTEAGYVDEWKMTGTQAGELRGVPPTGKWFAITGAGVAIIRDGKLARMTNYWNLAGLLRQIGVMSIPSY